MGAYASATDCADERFEDGLHVVYGTLEAETPSRSVSFVANGARFGIDPERLLEPASGRAHPAPQDWMAQVSRDVQPAPKWGYYGGSWGGGFSGGRDGY